MSQEDVIASPIVVFQDPFNFKNLYKLIKFWLEDNGYINGNGTSEKEIEIFYSEQVRLGDVKEYHIWWRTNRQPKNQYFKYKIDVNFLGLGMKNTEVVKNDKKHKMQIGEITVMLKATLVTEANDKSDKWKNHWFYSGIRNWFREKWYRAKIEQHENILYEEIYKLQTAIKEYLELYQYTTAPDLFFNKKGIE
ncbi:hypothetical protein KY334_06830 [Candidatus Woesearchaeota archaeon]|nr:hypothetical protein [Candidatus Woesearchaeota archaeon]